VIYQMNLGAESGCIQRDSATDLYWCGLCAGTDPCGRPEDSQLALIGYMTADVVRHLGSSGHVGRVEVRDLCIEEFCPVEINGIRMALDNHAVFPSAMFGTGRTLYDETIGCLLTVDACGGISLFPQHRYTIVDLAIPEEARDPKPPRLCSARFRHFDRRRWRVMSGDRKAPASVSQQILETINAGIAGEQVHRRRRKRHFLRAAVGIAKKVMGLAGKCNKEEEPELSPSSHDKE
jgi:hypothetical protein